MHQSCPVPTRPRPGDLACSLTSVSSLSEWQQVFSERFTPVAAFPVSDQPFSAKLRSRALDAVRLARMTATPHRIQHAAALNGAAGPGHYLLVLPTSGSVVVSQDGRKAALRPGDWSIWDTTRPYDLLVTEHAELVVVMFPHWPTGVPAQEIKGLTATRMDTDDGLAAVVLPLLMRLEERLDSYHPCQPATVAGNVLNLLATLLLESQASNPAGRPALLLHGMQFIDGRLADPNLSADQIAAAQHISTRYLRKLFESQGMTVSGWIRQRRLERCREELTDPNLSHLPVSAVAARWGLLPAAHFSRLFKQAYGQTPRDYRRTHLPDTTNPANPHNGHRDITR